jgi:hypothetical protein
MQQSGIPVPSRVQEAFDQVLTQPEFQYAGTSPVVRWVAAAWNWFGRMVRRWLPNLDESQIRLLSWLLLGAAVAVAVSMAVRWIRARRKGKRSGGATAVSRPSGPLDAVGWGEWARAKARAGQLREAASGLYQAAILHLDARGAVRFREWKTPGDYALEMSDQEALRAPFLDFLGQFVEVAFGPHEPTPETFASLSAGAERLGCPI